MAGVAQHFDRLQKRIEQRIGRRHRIHEHCGRAFFGHAPRLAQPGADIVPVMGAEPGDDKIETRIGEWKFFHRSLLRLEIGEPAIARFLRHRRKHLRRKIVSCNLAHMRRNREARMAAAAAEIERVREFVDASKFRKLLQVFALCMHRALHISRGARTELFADQVVNGVAHHFAR
ncbi:MAG TPA: hypothetical protein VHD95_08700 [Rhizomicrobium sp.]|nr:hypothetical protein [Rhizomicrobium sp.]